MRQNNDERRIAKLLKEFKRLSAQHSETMAKASAKTSPKLREAYVKRAQMLKQRIRLLETELERLHRSSSQSTTRHKKPVRSELSH